MNKSQKEDIGEKSLDVLFSDQEETILEKLFFQKRNVLGFPRHISFCVSYLDVPP